MYLKIAKKSDLKPGEKKRIKVAEQFIMLCNIEGQFYAVSDTCTHKAASLSQGNLIGKLIECPWHGSRFDIETGKPVTLPAVIPLKTYQVKVEGEDVLISFK